MGAVDRQEMRKARDVVGVAVLKYVGALRVHEFAIRVEHEQERKRQEHDRRGPCTTLISLDYRTLRIDVRFMSTSDNSTAR